MSFQDAYGGGRNVKVFGQQLDDLLVGRAFDRGVCDFDPKLVRTGLLDQDFARPSLNFNPDMSVCFCLHRCGRISEIMGRGSQELLSIKCQRPHYK